MKIFMLIIDGLGDDPNPALRGMTPLEAASAPCLSELAARSRVGFVRTVHCLPPESLSCIAGLLGYSPDVIRSLGRAYFEALARKVALGAGDLAFRCNIVALSGRAAGGDRISDFTGGAISDADAAEALGRIAALPEGWELYAGQSYRNLLVVRGAGVKMPKLVLYPPHMHQDEPISGIMPRALEEGAKPLASGIRDFMLYSKERLGHSRMLWLWSPSEHVPMQAFEEMHGIKGAAVAGLDFMNGLAAEAGMMCEKIPGATGYLDTDYEAKASAAIEWFGPADFVLVHVNAADEAAHARDPFGKMEAIEKTDRLILGPVFRFLKERFAHDFAIAVCSDHKTSSLCGLHKEDPVPCMIYRDCDPAKIAPGLPGGKRFCESMAGDAIDSFDLIDAIKRQKC